MQICEEILMTIFRIKQFKEFKFFRMKIFERDIYQTAASLVCSQLYLILTDYLNINFKNRIQMSKLGTHEKKSHKICIRHIKINTFYL